MVAYRAADRGRAEDSRRERNPERRTGRDALAGAVAGGGLVPVLVHLGAGVFGEHGRVIGPGDEPALLGGPPPKGGRPVR